jgi:hypothetical protein
MSVSQAIDGNSVRDKIQAVHSAYIDSENYLNICLEGVTDKGQEHYWLSVPITRMANRDDKLWQYEGYSNSSDSWTIPRKQITYSGCSEPPTKVMSYIGVKTLDMGSRLESPYKYHSNIENEASKMGKLVAGVYFLIDSSFLEDDSNNTLLGYVDPNLSFEDYKSFFMVTKEYCTDCSDWWSLMMPFAIVFDILTAPITLLMLSQTNFN